jgi:hypothetical protein
MGDRSPAGEHLSHEWPRGDGTARGCRQSGRGDRLNMRRNPFLTFQSTAERAGYPALLIVWSRQSPS